MPTNEKYLDHIQSVITRHNSNSFTIKGWTITICTAVFALAGTLKEPYIALIALVPIIVFWRLDSFYLANERCFISLYNAAINDYCLKVKNNQLLKRHQVKTEIEEGKFKIEPEKEVDFKTSLFSMNFHPFKQIARNNWQNTFKSSTILWFYFLLICFSIALFLGLSIFLKPSQSEPLKISTKIESDSLLIKTDKRQTIINNIYINDSLLKNIPLKNKE